jgi:hypothetical protein
MTYMQKFTSTIVNEAKDMILSKDWFVDDYYFYWQLFWIIKSVSIFWLACIFAWMCLGQSSYKN